MSSGRKNFNTLSKRQRSRRLNRKITTSFSGPPSSVESDDFMDLSHYSHQDNSFANLLSKRTKLNDISEPQINYSSASEQCGEISHSESD